MDPIRYVISEQYSDALGARFVEQSEYSGQDFRESILEKLYDQAKRENRKVEINLDGTFGLPPSFLEEAFGGLSRAHPKERVFEVFSFVCTDEPSVIPEISTYIKSGYTGRNL